MVAVVVHHCDSAGLAANLETAIDSAKTGDACCDLLRRQSQLMCDGYGSRGIQRVVAAGDMQLERAEHAGGRVHLEVRETACARLREIRGGNRPRAPCRK